MENEILTCAKMIALLRLQRYTLTQISKESGIKINVLSVISSKNCGCSEKTFLRLHEVLKTIRARDNW